MVAAIPTQDPPLEIRPETAKEIIGLKIATLIDVRQPTELELEGEIPEAESVPLFDLKKILGHKLTDEEQEILDCDLPTEKDARLFLSIIGAYYGGRDYETILWGNSEDDLAS